MTNEMCKEGHSYSLRSCHYDMTPAIYEFECGWCREQVFSWNKDFSKNQPLHPACQREEHFWLWNGCGMPGCCPIYYECARCHKPCTREQYVEAVKLRKDFNLTKY